MKKLKVILAVAFIPTALAIVVGLALWVPSTQSTDSDVRVAGIQKSAEDSTSILTLPYNLQSPRNIFDPVLYKEFGEETVVYSQGNNGNSIFYLVVAGYQASGVFEEDGVPQILVNHIPEDEQDDVADFLKPLFPGNPISFW